MIFYQRLKELRKDYKLTAKDVASIVNCSTNLIYDWEHGRCEPAYSVLSKLADLFRCSIDYLLGREDDFGNITVISDETNLSKDEQTVLSCFQSLDIFQREAILIQLKALAGKNKENELIKK